MCMCGYNMDDAKRGAFNQNTIITLICHINAGM
jgi:hypothetical protein